MREFAARRTDIFGDEEVSVGSRVGEKKKKKDDKPTWDGHSASAQSVALAATGNVQQQIKTLHEGLATQPTKPTMGPK